ncbi:CpsD/CapB family tyrosine-protein kinase [Ligilactobacillus acidipiscis]|uniref:CpsD/CapB family tyrosine-protein kinase n=1 Tax=Ligilactobacillus acidipiscis TaxID=89059 RepID=UPI0023F79A0E|nr:CpsD/CapB family tyrosine-protein kinase [Ligilactobacillus acidipiscis]WEV56545.1 CpsD/CapB family tyrosine-protein kinase [Ligilactobacillus acidipiscis]
MFKRNRKADNYSAENGVPLITIQEKGSVNSEKFNTIRTNIQFSNVESQRKSFMITSSIESEGKSTVSGNIAAAFAKQGKRVILVDSDLRKPTVQATFSATNERGISNYITDRSLSLEDVIFESTIYNLSVIKSGPIPPNPSELIGSTRMQDLANQLKKKYDIIIFDAPPILSVTDAQILSTYVDGTILVIRRGYTYKEDVKKAIKQVENVGGKLIGAILNDISKNDDTSYGYGYHK